MLIKNTYKEIYIQYIALDWSQNVVLMARMHKASTKVQTYTLHADPKEVREIINKFPESKILTIEETKISHWLYVELKDCADEILICNLCSNHLMKDRPQNDTIALPVQVVILPEFQGLNNAYIDFDCFHRVVIQTNCN